MDSLNYIKLFNQLVDDFFNEMIEIFPEETKIKVQYTLFQTIIKINIRKPCTSFMIGSVKYLEKISNRDSDFFLSSDKPQLLSSLNIENIWKDLSDNTKNAIWKYIQSFFTVGIKIIEMPQESYFHLNKIISFK
jgi:hypothetical protein